MLAGVEVGRNNGGGLEAEFTVEDALNHPEHVGGGEDDAGCAQDCPADVMIDAGLHGAGEDEELAYEAVEHGQADDRKGGDDEEGHHPGELRGEAAVLAHVVGAVTLVEEAEEEEEGCAPEAFVEGLEDTAVEAGDGEGEDTEDDYAYVAEGGVSGEPLEIFLDEGEQRAVDDADGSERDQAGSDATRLVGEDAEGEAKDRVETELAGEDHDGCSRGFRDSV